MAPPKGDVLDALLTWANDALEDDNQVVSLKDLIDGYGLFFLLRDLDPSTEAQIILSADQGPDPVETYVYNLEEVYDDLFRYIGLHCPELRASPPRPLFPVVDGAAAAAATSDPELLEAVTEILSTMIVAAFLGPDTPKYVGRLQAPGRFDQQTMLAIQKIIMSKQTELKPPATSTPPSQEAGSDDYLPSPPPPPPQAAADGHAAYDPYMQEDYEEVVRQLELTRRSYAETLQRLDRLQDSYQALRSEEAKLHQELEALRRATRDGASDSKVIKLLEDKIKEQDELISQQETQMEDDRRLKTRLEKEVATLRQKAEKLERMEEEVKELRVKNDDLARKANIGERYKQKLEGQQHLVREVQNLQFEKNQLQETLRDYEKLVAKTKSLERTLAEVRTSHASSEEELFELNRQRRTMDHELQALRQEIRILEEQRLHDERFIHELQDQLMVATGSNTAAGEGGVHGGEHLMVGEDADGGLRSHPTSPRLGARGGGGVGAGVSLEDELEGLSSGGGGGGHNTDAKLAVLRLEITKLTAENQMLKSNLTSGDAAHLRAELDEEQRKHSRLRQLYDESLGKLAREQEQTSQLIERARAGGDQDLAFLSDQLKAALAELDRERRSKMGLEEQVADLQRQTSRLEADLTAVGAEEQAALETLKATDKLVARSLQDENKSLRSRLQTLSDDHEVHRSQLLQALLDRDKFRMEVDHRREDGGPAPKDKDVANRPSTADKPPLTDTSDGRSVAADDKENHEKKDAKIAQLRERLQQRIAQLQKYAEEKLQSEHQLRITTQNNTALQSENTRLKAYQETLARENQLMSSSLRDLFGRVDTNTISLNRRRETPKSLVNRSRQAINNFV